MAGTHATPNLKDLAAWWSMNPNANIATPWHRWSGWLEQCAERRRVERRAGPLAGARDDVAAPKGLGLSEGGRQENVAAGAAEVQPNGPAPVESNGRPARVACQSQRNRDNALFWAACRAAETPDLDPAPLIAAAVQVGLTEREARRTVRSAYQRVGRDTIAPREPATPVQPAMGITR